MFRCKSNKKAFIMTALIILLCLVCLTGATLALFTSNLNDGTIGIVTTTGSVKVDIVDTSPKQNTLVDKVLQFQTSSTQKVILFEPGATFYTQGFQIKNQGNIPINFRLSVSEDENLDMEEFNRAFEVWITTDPKDTGSAQRLPAFEGRLEKNGDCSATYYLVIKMKETADNSFQGKSYQGIGVTVYAVQGNVDIKE